MLTGMFDSHAHYDDEKFQLDRTQVLENLWKNGVARVMNIGADLSSSRAAVGLAENYGQIYAAVGIHPHSTPVTPDDYLAQLEAMVKECPKVRAIGEIGLDYYYDGSYKPLQKRFFIEQLVLAKQLGLPVVIHDRDAHGDTMDILREYRPKGIVHCFSGSAEMAAQVTALGMYVGFTGVVTFKNARRSLEAAQIVPLDRMLIETDCPYMAPVPYRGKRCDSTMLPQTVEVLASIKGVSPEELVRITYENACCVYEIPVEK